MTLSRRQDAFIHAYMHNGFNALGAARKAGYSKKDRHAGRRLLKNPAVHAELVQRLTHRETQIEVDAEAIRQAFARVAFDPRLPGRGGPTRSERMVALDRLAKLAGLYINKTLLAGVSLEELLMGVDQLEAQAGPAEPPVRNPH